MVTRIGFLSHQLAHGQSIRDLLRPRLISGQQQVEDLPIVFPPGISETPANRGRT
jgi:hypothetical protein